MSFNCTLVLVLVHDLQIKYTIQEIQSFPPKKLQTVIHMFSHGYLYNSESALLQHLQLYPYACPT